MRFAPHSRLSRARPSSRLSTRAKISVKPTSVAQSTMRRARFFPRGAVGGCPAAGGPSGRANGLDLIAPLQDHQDDHQDTKHHPSQHDRGQPGQLPVFEPPGSAEVIAGDLRLSAAELTRGEEIWRA